MKNKFCWGGRSLRCVIRWVADWTPNNWMYCPSGRVLSPVLCQEPACHERLPWGLGSQSWECLYCMWMYGHAPKQREHLAFGGVRTPDLWHIGHLLGRQNPPREAILSVVGGPIGCPADILRRLFPKESTPLNRLKLNRKKVMWMRRRIIPKMSREHQLWRMLDKHSKGNQSWNPIL